MSGTRAARNSHLPSAIGRYQVVSEIGKGGMGRVFKGRLEDGPPVAIKLLVVGADDDEIIRFDRERRLQECLSEGEGFVPLLESGVCEEGFYLVMPLVSGGTLRDGLEQGPLTVPETLELARALAKALAHAHEIGIVHRDLKPENVLFDDEGTPLIADLGIAKHFGGQTLSPSLTRTGLMQGTVRYMAPEQAENSRDVGPQADIFALGAILYECLAGRPAFPGEGIVQTLRAILRGRPAELLSTLRPDVPPALHALIDRALCREPGGRFQDGGELLRALVEMCGLERPRPRPRKRHVAVLASLVVSVPLVGAGLASLFSEARPQARKVALGHSTAATNEELLEARARERHVILHAKGEEEGSCEGQKEKAGKPDDEKTREPRRSEADPGPTRKARSVAASKGLRDETAGSVDQTREKASSRGTRGPSYGAVKSLATPPAAATPSAPGPSAPVLNAIVIETDGLTISQPGFPQQLQAVGLFSDGRLRDVTRLVAWKPSDPAVVAIDRTGVATPRAQGNVAVEARIGGLSSVGTLNVAPGAAAPVNSSTPGLVPPDLVLMSPSERNLVDPRAEQQLVVLAVWRSGLVVDVTRHAAIRLSDANLADVDAYGVLRARGIGVLTVTARWGGFEASSTFALDPSARLPRGDLAAPIAVPSLAAGPVDATPAPLPGATLAPPPPAGRVATQPGIPEQDE